MKLYYLLPLLTLNCAFVSSCGDSGGGDSGGGEATSEVKSSVRAKLPLYYDIQKVSAETSEQNMMGEMLSITQLAIEVTLKENLYKRSSMTQELSVKLKLASDKVHFTIRSTFNANNKTFIEKVASKGEEKTIYGELIIKILAGGKEEIDTFKYSNASGSAISAFNQSEIIITGSKMEKVYAQSIYNKLVEKRKIAQAKKDKLAAEHKAKMESIRIENERLSAERKAKMEAEQKERRRLAEEKAKKLRVLQAEKLRKDQAERDRLAAEMVAQIEAAKQAVIDRYEVRLNRLVTVLKEGNVYEGVFKNETAEKVQITLVSFDPKLLFGIVNISSKEMYYSFNLNINLSSVINRSEKLVKIMGKAEALPEVSTELKNKSILVRGSRNMTVRGYEITDDGVITINTSTGDFLFKE